MGGLLAVDVDVKSSMDSRARSQTLVTVVVKTWAQDDVLIPLGLQNLSKRVLERQSGRISKPVCMLSFDIICIV